MGSILGEVFGHNTWANVRLLEVCSTLTDEQLDTSVEGTYGTIRATLLHLMSSEEHYLYRLTGTKPDPPLREEKWPGFHLLRERAGSHGERFAAVIDTEDLERVQRWTTMGGEDAAMPLGLFLVQAINHGNEHRSQVATVLTHVGIEPPELSGWLYAIETGQLTGVKA